jgi:hypothetical protein
MSPSDLKQVEAPLWIEPGRGKPTLMLFSAVDWETTHPYILQSDQRGSRSQLVIPGARIWGGMIEEVLLIKYDSGFPGRARLQPLGVGVAEMGRNFDDCCV